MNFKINFKPLTIFAKILISYVWLGSEFALEFFYVARSNNSSYDIGP